MYSANPEWRTFDLGTISDVFVGGTPSTEIPLFWGGDIPWMTSGDAHLKRIIDVPGRINSKAIRSSAATIVEPPAVALALAGQGKTRGTVALVLERMSSNQSVALIRPRQDYVNAAYLFYNLDWRYNELRSRSDGDGRAGLTKALIEQIPILLPPAAEQGRIVNILDTVDTEIEIKRQYIAKLHSVWRGLLIDLLEPRHDADVATIQELLADIRPAMRSGPFGSALRKEELVKAGIPLLGIDNIGVDCFIPHYTRFVSPEKFRALRRYEVHPDDVIVTIMGTVGRCSVAPRDIGTALSSKHIWTLTFDTARYLPWLACIQINFAPWVLRHFAADQQGGTMAAIRADTIRSTPLTLLPMDEQRQIQSRLRAMIELIEQEKLEVAKLQRIRQGLLDDLISGKVRVTSA